MLILVSLIKLVENKAPGSIFVRGYFETLIWAFLTVARQRAVFERKKK